MVQKTRLPPKLCRTEALFPTISKCSSCRKRGKALNKT